MENTLLIHRFNSDYEQHVCLFSLQFVYYFAITELHSGVHLQFSNIIIYIKHLHNPTWMAAEKWKDKNIMSFISLSLSFALSMIENDNVVFASVRKYISACRFRMNVRGWRCIFRLPWHGSLFSFQLFFHLLRFHILSPDRIYFRY